MLGDAGEGIGSLINLNPSGSEYQNPRQHLIQVFNNMIYSLKNNNKQNI
jgi:hypothetical protein